MTSILIAGPGEEPVTLAQAKAWCRIDGDDEDDLVAALIAAARLQVEGSTGRALVTQSWRLALDRPTGRLVPLPVLPVAALVAVTVDGQSVDAALQGDCVLLPAPATQSLSIDYTAGYGDAAAVPADLQQAVLVLVAYWFENRDAAAPAQLPSGFDRLLAGYRRVQL